MRLFLLTRTDHVGYDEYDAKVIAAESEDRARFYQDLLLRRWVYTEPLVNDLSIITHKSTGLANFL